MRESDRKTHCLGAFAAQYARCTADAGLTRARGAVTHPDAAALIAVVGRIVAVRGVNNRSARCTMGLRWL
eukprot:51072-Eustigmatos_ZCMA.PRE.1